MTINMHTFVGYISWWSTYICRLYFMMIKMHTFVGYISWQSIWCFLVLSDIDSPQVLVTNNLPLSSNNITLTCFIQANPHIINKNWIWKHNGHIIGTSNMLSLHDVSTLNSGIYECIARNKVGNISNTTEIAVICMLNSLLLYNHTCSNRLLSMRCVLCRPKLTLVDKGRVWGEWSKIGWHSWTMKVIKYCMDLPCDNYFTVKCVKTCVLMLWSIIYMWQHVF